MEMLPKVAEYPYVCSTPPVKTCSNSPTMSMSDSVMSHGSRSVEEMKVELDELSDKWANSQGKEGEGQLKPNSNDSANRFGSDDESSGQSSQSSYPRGTNRTVSFSDDDSIVSGGMTLDKVNWFKKESFAKKNNESESSTLDEVNWLEKKSFDSANFSDEMVPEAKDNHAEEEIEAESMDESKSSARDLVNWLKEEAFPIVKKNDNQRDYDEEAEIVSKEATDEKIKCLQEEAFQVPKDSHKEKSEGAPGKQRTTERIKWLQEQASAKKQRIQRLREKQGDLKDQSSKSNQLTVDKAKLPEGTFIKNEKSIDEKDSPISRAVPGNKVLWLQEETFALDSEKRTEDFVGQELTTDKVKWLQDRAFVKEAHSEDNEVFVSQELTTDKVKWPQEKAFPTKETEDKLDNRPNEDVTMKPTHDEGLDLNLDGIEDFPRKKLSDDVESETVDAGNSFKHLQGNPTVIHEKPIDVKETLNETERDIIVDDVNDLIQLESIDDDVKSSHEASADPPISQGNTDDINDDPPQEVEDITSDSDVDFMSRKASLQGGNRENLDTETFTEYFIHVIEDPIIDEEEDIPQPILNDNLLTKEIKIDSDKDMKMEASCYEVTPVISQIMESKEVEISEDSFEEKDRPVEKVVNEGQDLVEDNTSKSVADFMPKKSSRKNLEVETPIQFFSDVVMDPITDEEEDIPQPIFNDNPPEDIGDDRDSEDFLDESTDYIVNEMPQGNSKGDLDALLAYSRGRLKELQSRADTSESLEEDNESDYEEEDYHRRGHGDAFKEYDRFDQSSIRHEDKLILTTGSDSEKLILRTITEATSDSSVTSDNGSNASSAKTPLISGSGYSRYSHDTSVAVKDEEELDDDEQSLGSHESLESHDYKVSPVKISRGEVVDDKLQNDNKELWDLLKYSKIRLTTGKIPISNAPVGNDDIISVDEDNYIEEPKQKERSFSRGGSSVSRGGSSVMDESMMSYADESEALEDVFAPKVTSRGIESVDSARQRARAALAMTDRDVRLTEIQILQSIILAEKASLEGQAEFQTWDKVENLKKVPLKFPPKPSRVTITAQRLRNRARHFFRRVDSVNRINAAKARPATPASE
jgi:hypothetical protein